MIARQTSPINGLWDRTCLLGMPLLELLYFGKAALLDLSFCCWPSEKRTAAHTKPNPDCSLRWHYLTLLTVLKGWTTGHWPNPSSFTTSASCSHLFILKSAPSPPTTPNTQRQTHSWRTDWLSEGGGLSAEAEATHTDQCTAKFLDACTKKGQVNKSVFFPHQNSYCQIYVSLHCVPVGGPTD